MQYIESDTLMFVSTVALAGWIYWLHFRRRQHLADLKKIQLQLSVKALDKFGEAKEFVAFLQSREGQAMLYDGKSQDDSRSRTTIRFLQAGIILIFVGIGLFLCASRYDGTLTQDLSDVLALLTFTGTVSASMGVGLLASAAVTSLWERISDRPLHDRG